jgi:hypothetical protein
VPSNFPCYFLHLFLVAAVFRVSQMHHTTWYNVLSKYLHFLSVISKLKPSISCNTLLQVLSEYPNLLIYVFDSPPSISPPLHQPQQPPQRPSGHPLNPSTLSMASPPTSTTSRTTTKTLGSNPMSRSTQSTAPSCPTRNGTAQASKKVGENGNLPISTIAVPSSRDGKL